MTGESPTPTPYAVHCRGVDPEVGAGPCNSGGPIYLTLQEYSRQLANPWSFWRCPRCNADATWNDEIYEAAIGIPPPEELEGA